MICQAVELDTKVMGEPSDLYPCEGLGEVEVDGFFLCEDCAATLEFITGPTMKGIVERVKQANREECDEAQRKRDGTPTSKDLEEWL